MATKQDSDNETETETQTQRQLRQVKEQRPDPKSKQARHQQKQIGAYVSPHAVFIEWHAYGEDFSQVLAH